MRKPNKNTYGDPFAQGPWNCPYCTRTRAIRAAFSYLHEWVGEKPVPSLTTFGCCICGSFFLSSLSRQKRRERTQIRMTFKDEMREKKQLMAQLVAGKSERSIWGSFMGSKLSGTFLRHGRENWTFRMRQKLLLWSLNHFLGSETNYWLKRQSLAEGITNYC